MKTYVSPKIDRSTWPRGEWDSEPDKVQWKDETTGLACLAVRGPMGAWCGYVGVPRGHAAYEIEYSRVDVNVHGGLTFADHCHDGDESRSICHVPEPGEPDDVWWLGFDCSHAWDESPGMLARGLGGSGEAWYKNQAYVMTETKRLAAQLAVVTRVGDEP